MKINISKIPFLLSLIFLLLTSFACIFLYRTIRNNNAQADITISEWQTEANRRTQIGQLDDSIRAMDTERSQLETHFAKSSDIVPFLDTIEKIGPEVGAVTQVSAVNILADNRGLLVGIKASGSFESIYKFITLVENSPYEVQFVSMDMKKDMGTGGSIVKGAKWSATFGIKLLSFIQ